MATIQEEETKNSRADHQGLKAREVAHREDTLAKLMHQIESAKRKAGGSLISEIPTDQWLKKYTEETKEDG